MCEYDDSAAYAEDFYDDYSSLWEVESDFEYPDEEGYVLTRGNEALCQVLDHDRYRLCAPAGELSSHMLGVEGERIAAQYLQDQGFELVERNWRCRFGEADIVAKEDPDSVVMVEVKTRRVRRFRDAMPEVAVNLEKRDRYAKLASLYLATDYSVSSVRFDVIGISVRGDEPIRLHHIRGAFELDK